MNAGLMKIQSVNGSSIDEGIKVESGLISHTSTYIPTLERSSLCTFANFALLIVCPFDKVPCDVCTNVHTSHGKSLGKS